MEAISVYHKDFPWLHFWGCSIWWIEDSIRSWGKWDIQTQRSNT